MALEVKDDENKSNDHHQISNNLSESGRRGGEEAPIPWSAHNESNKKLKWQG